MRVHLLCLFVAVCMSIGIVRAVGSSDDGEASSRHVLTPDHPPVSASRNDLPSEDELHRAMTEHPFREGMRSFSWPPDISPWIPTSPRSLYKGQPHQPHHIIPPFTRLVDGKRYGPLAIGGSKFEAKPYPLDLPFFHHTYLHPDELAQTPINFESLQSGRTLRFGDWFFRPEPEILDYIQTTLRKHLQLAHHEPQAVLRGGSLKQGQAAWPPVQFRPHHSLGMPVSLVGLHRLAVERQIQSQTRKDPRVYHLAIPTYGGVRHVMMTRVKAAELTNVQRSSRETIFWLLHEAMMGKSARFQGEVGPRYALLGGVFLPHNAPELLKGIMYPAFLDDH